MTQDIQDQSSSIILYEWGDGHFKLEVHFEDETAWLSQRRMAELFDCSTDNISLHLKNIFKEHELDEKSVVEDFSVTASDGKTYKTKHYNLDAIIAVGYRVNSKKATHFRIWATGILREYIKKGFAMDDERLKNAGGGNYWKELLDRIRDIRSSEKALYRQVLDLYATSIDYDPKSQISIQFFKIVQNKLHYATNQHTAAETIHERADATKDWMGLTTFAGAMPTLAEAKIAKNYLTHDELFRLNRMVSAFFDLAEIKAQEQTQMTMQDWITELDKFATNYGKGVLTDAGTVSHDQAIDKATAQYRDYQAKTLSPVESAYLESIKAVAKKVEKEGKR